MTEPAKRTPLWRRLIQIAVTVVFVGFLIWALAGRWSEVKDVIGDLTIRALVLSLLAAVAAVWCTFLSWRAILADFGHRVPISGGMRIFFVGQLAKYLPGKVWPVVTQMRLGRAYQVPGRSSAAAVLITMLMSLGTALLVTACVLPILGDSAFSRYWWTLLVLPVAAAALWPGILNALLNKTTKVLKREPMPQPLTGRGIALSAAWSIAAWLLFGVHLWLLLQDLGATGGDLIVRSIGAFAGSWAVGFMLAIVPAGVGPREVALVVLLGPSVGEPIALVAAVISRLLMTAADLIWPGIAVLIERRRQRGLAAEESAADIQVQQANGGAPDGRRGDDTESTRPAQIHESPGAETGAPTPVDLIRPVDRRVDRLLTRRAIAQRRRPAADG